MLTPDQENQLHAAGYVLMRSQAGSLTQDWIAQVPGREVIFTVTKARRYTQEELQLACIKAQAYQEAPAIPKPWTRQPTTALAKGYLSESRWRFSDARWHHEVLGMQNLILPKAGMALLSKGTQDILLEMYQAGMAATRLLRKLKQEQEQAAAQAKQLVQEPAVPVQEAPAPVPEPAPVEPVPVPVATSPVAPALVPAQSSVDQLWRLLGKPDALQELLARAREERATSAALADEAQAAKVQAEEMLRQARQAVEAARQAVVTAQILEADAEAKLKTAESEAVWALEHFGEAELRMNALATLAGLGKTPDLVLAPVPAPVPEPAPVPVAPPEALVRYVAVRQVAVTGRPSSPEGVAMDAFMAKAGAAGATLGGVMQHLREKGLDRDRGARTFRDRIRYGIYKAI